MTLRGSERKFWLMSETQEGNLDEWASDRERERKTTKWVRSVPEMKHMSFFFCFRSPFGRGRRCIKKTVPFPCPQVFIFVHCRLVSQCNAPPITSHSFAPMPHPSRPSAHAPNTLWRQQLLRVGGGVRFCRPQSTSYPPPLPSPPPRPLMSLLASFSSPHLFSWLSQPRMTNLPRSLFFPPSFLFLRETVMHQKKRFTNRVLKKCYNSVAAPPTSFPPPTLFLSIYRSPPPSVSPSNFYPL